jgi:Mg2+ and Co2+ transporter CorA
LQRGARYIPAAFSQKANIMAAAFYHLTTLATVAVLAVLLLGLWNMMRGRNPNTSQKLMRWRVGLQFVAIVIIMITVYLTR